MRISRLLLTGAAVGTIAGTGWADLNRTHVVNPDWPPHARFHSAAGWGSIVGSQMLALWLLWRRPFPGPRVPPRPLPSSAVGQSGLLNCTTARISIAVPMTATTSNCTAIGTGQPNQVIGGSSTARAAGGIVT